MTTRLVPYLFLRWIPRLLALILLMLGLGLSASTLEDSARVNAFCVQLTRVASHPTPGPAEQLVLAGAPASPSVERLLGVYALRSGDQISAERHFRSALEGGEDRLPLIRTMQMLSVPLAQTAYRLYPDNEEATVWLADALTDSEPAASIALYQQAIRLNPNDNLAWESLGHLADYQGLQDLALQADKEACRITPLRNGPCHQAARLSYDRGDWAAVVYYFERGSMPEHASDWVLLVHAAWRLGHYSQASDFLRQAQVRNPADYAQLLLAP